MKILVSLFLFLLMIITNYSIAENLGQSTGYKLPRFVSTKSDESNLRVGANLDYPILLTYKVKSFPLKIIDEYEIWRKVIDIDGNQGWMHKSLLQSNRYGIIKTAHEQGVQVYNKPEGVMVGKIGNRNIVKINKCFNLWCHISLNNHQGWINKINIWGVDNNENFNMPFYQFIINLYWKII